MRKIDYSEIEEIENKYLTYMGYYDNTGVLSYEGQLYEQMWYDIKEEIIQVYPVLKNSIMYIKKYSELLTMKFEDLVDIYLDWEENKISDNPEIDALVKQIFNYDEKRTSIAAFFIYFRKVLKIYTCFYCDASYINLINESNKKRLFDMDHFLPNAKSPLTSLSLYNFVPACLGCNRVVKSSQYLSNLYNLDNDTSRAEKKKILVKLSPTSSEYNFSENVLLKVEPHNKYFPISFRDQNDEYDIVFKVNSNSVYQKHIDAFELNSLYNCEAHKDYALGILELKRKYPDIRIHELTELINTNSNISISEDELKEDIFHTKMENKSYRVFSKLKQDLLIQ